MLDILIKNGKYADFDSKEFTEGDVGIKDGKIISLGDTSQKAKEVIDAKGKIISPGFIDIHMHEEDFIKDGDEYIISEMMLKMGVTTCLGGNCGVQFQKLKEFKEKIENHGGSPVNYLMLVGYNQFRRTFDLGFHDKITKEKLKKLIPVIKSEVEEGAFGISFGIEYDPGITEEEMMEVLNSFDDNELFISAHYRSDAHNAVEAINEMIRICNNSKKKFQISHLSSCSACGQMEEALAIIDEGVKKNPKLGYDTYPYNAFSTFIGSAVFEEGCFESWNKSYDCVFIPMGKYKGQFCTKEIFEELRETEPELMVVAFVMNEEEIGKAIKDKNGIVASDGIISGGLGHPRAAGTFPRVLGKYVREEGLIDLITALEKMTIMPAKRLGLTNKGQIKLGMDADITIFDKDIVADGATFEELKVDPVGIEYVIVNGKISVFNNNIVNNKAGEFISYKD